MEMGRVDELLIRAKLKPGKKGFHQLSDVLTLMLEDKNFHGYGICEYYKQVAKKHNTHFAGVQHNIKRSIEEAVESSKSDGSIDPDFAWAYKIDNVNTSEFVSTLYLMLKGEDLLKGGE